MNAATSAPAAAGARRTRHTGPLLPDADRDAKRTAAVILEVLAGMRTPLQAAEALGVSLPRYYQLEAQALAGLVAACTPKPKGRQANPTREAMALRRDNERLQRELARQQTLVRLSQRGLGVAPPPAKPVAKKGRQRKPVVRALTLATRLQAPPAEPAATPKEVTSTQQS
jgi:hypothetical protein